MTKADLISEITEKTGVEKIAVQATVESLMTSIIDAMESGENVYLRGFGSFVIKKRAEKTGRRRETARDGDREAEGRRGAVPRQARRRGRGRRWEQQRQRQRQRRRR